MMTLPEIKAEVDRLAALIGASGQILPTYGRTEDGARPHIEVDSHAYHYVVVERGQELKRITTTDLNELLFNLFKGITSTLSSRYAASHSIESQDFRRALFQRQVELLSSLFPHWGERESQRHKQILQQNPFDDNSNIRVRLTKDYTKKGHSPEVAWKMACERYPLPKA